MLKKITVFLLVLAVCGIALAAESVAGTITAVGENQVTITLTGDKPDWVKKNAPVKFPNAVGKVLEVSDPGVSPVVITVKTKKASTMKAGDAVSFLKGKAMAGC